MQQTLNSFTTIQLPTNLRSEGRLIAPNDPGIGLGAPKVLLKVSDITGIIEDKGAGNLPHPDFVLGEGDHALRFRVRALFGDDAHNKDYEGIRLAILDPKYEGKFQYKMLAASQADGFAHEYPQDGNLYKFLEQHRKDGTLELELHNKHPDQALYPLCFPKIENNKESGVFNCLAVNKDSILHFDSHGFKLVEDCNSKLGDCHSILEGMW